MSHKPHTHIKSCYILLNTHYRHTLGLGKEWILISLDKVVFGWAVRVAVVQLSPALLWSTSILLCMYLQSVTVCCDIGYIDKTK